MNVARLAPFFRDFRAGLSGAAERAAPRMCLLTPGPYSDTYFEQAYLARYLGFLLVEGDDLVVRDNMVFVRTIAGLKRADVIWRRVDADWCDPLELNAASRIGVAGLMQAIRAGNVVVANMPGAGMLESRSLLGFAPTLAQRLLGEDLLLPNIATWWCGQKRERESVIERMDELVISPAFGDALPGSTRRRRRARLGPFGAREERTGAGDGAPRHRLRRPGSRAPVHDARVARRQARAASVHPARVRRRDARTAGA